MEIVLDRVGRIYEWQWAIRNINATVEPGNCVCLLGANGSGKSTLLTMISGYMRPTEGRVLIGGRRNRLGAIHLRKQMMLIEPDQKMIGNNAVLHLGTAISLYDCDRFGIEDDAVKWLQALGIADALANSGKQSSRLSRGQQTKLWLATLFTVGPQIWLLDEPHQCGLDAQGIEVLEEQIEAHCKRGGTVIFTSQWPPHANRLANKVLLLSSGELAYFGSIKEMSEHYASRDPAIAPILRLLETEKPEGTCS